MFPEYETGVLPFELQRHEAARAGVEPAWDRLTAGCLTARLPCNVEASTGPASALFVAFQERGTIPSYPV